MHAGLQTSVQLHSGGLLAVSKWSAWKWIKAACFDFLTQGHIKAWATRTERSKYKTLASSPELHYLWWCCLRAAVCKGLS